MTNVHLTLNSRNRKIKGKKQTKVMVTTSGAETCPTTCPFKGNGCYAEGGPLKMHWDKVTRGERGGAWRELIDAVKQQSDGALWRHNQAGDLPGEGDTINRKELMQLALANRGKRGFTYTHKPVQDHPEAARNRAAIKQANRAGFTINLSANDLQHADELSELGIAPVATVLPADHTGNTRTPKGKLVIQCPATIEGKNVACADCGLCAVNLLPGGARANTRRRAIIGFPAHGVSKRKASNIAEM